MVWSKKERKHRLVVDNKPKMESAATVTIVIMSGKGTWSQVAHWTVGVQ